MGQAWAKHFSRSRDDVDYTQSCIKKKGVSPSQAKSIVNVGMHRIIGDNMYAKCGSFQVFYETCALRDVCSLTRVVGRTGFRHPALQFFRQMQTAGFQPNDLTFSSVISACRSVQHGMQLHQQAIKNGFDCQASVCNALVDFYGKCCRMRNARQVFDRMLHRDIVSWTIMIAAYARNGPFHEALALFYQMPVSGVQPNQFSFSAVISACASMGCLDEGVKIHEESITKGYESHVSVANALLHMYMKCGTTVEARQLFDRMPLCDVVSWTVMIRGYAKYGAAEEALSLFKKMEERGCTPNDFTLTGVLSAVAKLGSLRVGIDIHKKILRLGFQSHISVANALVAMYAKCGSIEKALDVFDKIDKPDVVSWNSMITGFAQNGLVDKAFDLFDKMPQRDHISWNAMIAGFMQNGFVCEALKLFKQIPERSAISWTTMIAGYAQAGNLDKALNLFNEMTSRDTVSWNAMIAGFGENGYDLEALKLFQQMQSAGVRPDSKTFAIVLPACAKIAALNHGMEIHEKIVANGFQSDILAGNALIHMYAKCGDIEKANEIFNRMHLRDAVSWTSMITGFAMHGYGEEALKHFEQMKLCGMNPDHITFLSVLSACTHRGLVDEGYEYFNCMTEDYRITPTMEHYRSMVDLLGRAGRLDEARDFIHNLPRKPDASIWNCLLGACRIHNHVELAEYVAGHIFELEPRNASPYVLLSNIYAAAGRWGEIQRVRKMMREKNIKKAPGCSWIEINRQVNAFLVGDTSHLENKREARDNILKDEDSKFSSKLHNYLVQLVTPDFRSPFQSF